MRIGIVTQPLLSNYGGILQNYALQQVLKDLGHDPITINYRRKISLTRWLGSTIRSTLFYFIPQKRRQFAKFKETLIVPREKSIQSFLDQNIELTEEVTSYHPKLVNRYKLDVVITGSDQVWRPYYNLCLEEMYLRFVKQAGVKKIAYAASFGTDEFEYTKGQILCCKKYAQRIDAISVRELSGVDICRSYFGVDAVAVLDPTLLLGKAYYDGLCKGVPKETKSSIVAYILDLDEGKQRIIDTVSKEQNLKANVILAEGNSKSVSVECWLAMFRDAKYVITDSFHGTVFSIIFQKPFLCIGNKLRGMARFNSLLSKFGLEDRLIEVSEFSSFEVPSIDWQQVSEVLKLEQNKSLRFLTKALGK